MAAAVSTPPLSDSARRQTESDGECAMAICLAAIATEKMKAGSWIQSNESIHHPFWPWAVSVGVGVMANTHKSAIIASVTYR